jgi:hypothetical protein
MLNFLRRLFVKPAPARPVPREAPKKKSSAEIRLERAAAVEAVRHERRK